MVMVIRFSIIFLLFLCSSFSVKAAPSINTSAQQAIVIDYDTGAVLFEKEPDSRMPTSSMSKVMSMYVVFEALSRGDITLNDTLLVSDKAWRKGGSKMFVEVGKRVHVEDLIRGVVVQSGNDATIVLAEGLAGSEDAFAQRLNETAKDLGMSNSHFMNASGWPDPDHYSTARDLATMAHAMIENFPEYYHYYAEHEFTFNNIKQANRNPLLYRNMGADGIKTGHTEAGGYGLIGSGKRFGRRVIVVLNGLSDERARAQESAKLLDWGLDRFENKTLFETGYVVADVPVLMGKVKTVTAVLLDDIAGTVPKNAQDQIKTDIKFHDHIEAPITKDQEIGTFIVTIPDQPSIQKTLYAASDIERVGFIKGTAIKLKMMISEQIQKRTGS